MNFTKLNLLILVFLILSTGFCKSVLADQPQSEKVIIELTIGEFLKDKKLEVYLDYYRVNVGAFSASHAKNLQAYSWGVTIETLRPNKARLVFRLNVSYVNGTKTKIEKKISVLRGRTKEYQLEGGIKIRTYYASD